MVVLHIARVIDNFWNGVCVVVPQHVRAQQQIETVGLLNISDYKVDGVDNLFEFKGSDVLSYLPSPFDKPDLVVFHEVYRPPYLKIAKFLRKRHIPYVILPHGELTKGAQKKKRLKKWAANLLLFNKFVNGAAAVQCLSENELHDTQFNVKKIIGTNGVEVPAAVEKDFSESSVKMLYIGRLDMYHKGLDLLIAAVKSVKSFMLEHNCKLYVYGPNHLNGLDEFKAEVIANGLEEIVIPNDSISGDAKRAELLSADYFIQTSRFEGMPLGVLEALSLGLPCVVTEGTNLAGFIDKNNAGWTCKTDAESIAEAIKQAIAERHLLNNKSQNAVKAIKENFGWDIIAADTLEKYKKILTDRSAG